jgi:hypothetical protein
MSGYATIQRSCMVICADCALTYVCFIQQSCTVSGLGLLCAEAGVEASFHIISRDEYANQKASGGDRYDVSLTGELS